MIAKDLFLVKQKSGHTAATSTYNSGRTASLIISGHSAQLALKRMTPLGGSEPLLDIQNVSMYNGVHRYRYL